MRSLWRLVLAVFWTGPACQGERVGPTLVRIEPSVVEEDALPVSATVVGENLRLVMRVSLDDENDAQLAAPRVTLNGTNAAWVAYRSANQLDVMLPTELAPGVYDVNVSLGQHRLVLPAGLRVLGEGESSAETRDVATADDATTSGSATTSSTGTGSETPDVNLATSSAATDASSADPPNGLRCGPGEFGPPELVHIQGYAGSRPWSPTLSGNYDTMYFTDVNDGTETLWIATRADRGTMFYGAPASYSLFATGGTGTPYISASGLSLYFYSTQVTGFGGGDLYLARRATLNSDFSYPLALTALNSPQLDYLPWISPDERTIVYVSQRTGASAYYTASRNSVLEGFGEPVPLPSLTHTENNGRLTISGDGLRAYFTSRNRPGGRGLDDVWYATRPHIDQDFENITNLSIANTPGSETEVTVTQDGEELYFIRMGATSSQLHRSLAMCP